MLVINKRKKNARVVVGAKVPAELKSAIDKAAADAGVSTSSLIEQALEHVLTLIEQEPEEPAKPKAEKVAVAKKNAREREKEQNND